MRAKVKITSNLQCYVPLKEDILYFSGDIIEILNISGLVGHRYRVEVMLSNEMIKKPLTSKFDDFIVLHNNPKNINAVFSIIVDGNLLSSKNIRLYKRPFKNWVKNFFSLLTKKYIK